MLKEETRTVGRSRSRISLANTLLAGQVAVSLVLLVVAALFLRSIKHEYTIDPGFETKHLALFMLYPGQAGYDQPRTEQFYKQVRGRIAGVPGISFVSWASNLPLWGRKETGVTIEGQEQRKKSEAISTVVNTFDLDYFAALGISIVAGRDFTQDDRDISTPVAIVNDAMAAKYWPGQDAIGKRLQLPQGKHNFLLIVGVVKTANYQSLGEAPQACVYLPLRLNYSDSMILYVKTERDPSATLAAVQNEIRNIDPALPLEDVRTGTKVIDQALWGSKIGVGLLGVFGVLALGLASVGLYGIMAYSVSQRRREIGVRMALGAGQRDVSLFILRQGMVVVFSGIAVGGGLAILLGRALSRFLYGVSPNDPLSVGGAALVLLVVAFVACYLPARSATRVDPLVALRASKLDAGKNSSFILILVASIYSTTNKFCANAHSPSIHCPSHRNPVRSAIRTTSPARYLCELSVQIVSPALSVNRNFAAGISTDCSCIERKCISILLFSSFQRASCRKRDRSKSAPSSRLILASKFKLNAAVTPAGSLSASNCAATSFSKSVPSSRASPGCRISRTSRKKTSPAARSKFPIVLPKKSTKR